MLGVLPADLDATAREFGALVRRRNIPNAAVLIRLALAYALTDLSMKDVAALGSALGVAQITGPGFFYRLKVSERWLEHVLSQLLSEEVQVAPVGMRFKLVDATVVTGPGSKGTDWRIHVMLDAVSGKFCSVEFTDAKGAEDYSRFVVQRGEVAVGDRAYCTARGINSAIKAGGHVLVRLNPHSIRICDHKKQKLRLASYENMIRKKEIRSWEVLVPVPPDHVKGGKPWNLSKAKAWIPARVLATRTIRGAVIWVLTTLTNDQLPDETVFKVLGIRWQVELLFKRLKSVLHLSELPTINGPTAKSWLLCRFLAAALAQRLVTPTGVFSLKGNRHGLKPAIRQAHGQDIR